jgi:hypothetical protein
MTRRHSARRSANFVAVILVFAALGIAANATMATAAVPAPLWQAPPNMESGSGVGQIHRPEAVAADSSTGDVYVADLLNNRIDEFDAFGHFIKAIGWGVADGSSELQTCGPGATPPTSTCLEGLFGSEPGQFAFSFGGLTVDSAGNLYVGDLGNNRVQKFNSSGEFVWMVGGGVDQGPTNPGNLCTAASVAAGDTCGAGAFGNGPAEFEPNRGTGFPLAIGASGALLVGDEGHVHEIEPDGTPAGDFPDPSGVFAGKNTMGIAPDSVGGIYVAFEENDGVAEMDASGTLVATLPAGRPISLALDSSENLYVVATSPAREVLEYGPGGEPIIGAGSGFAAPASEGSLNGIAVNTVTVAGESDLYVTELVAGAEPSEDQNSIRAFGPTPDRWPLPPVAPEITAQFASEVGAESAVLKAIINPHFWPDATYYVEFGLGLCSAGGCSATVPVPPGRPLGGSTDFPVAAMGISLDGLLPGATYHFRFVAQSGGGAVKGVGASEAEGTFNTPGPTGAEESCPNRAFRTGAAVRLADCRAYEMVTPVEKSNADIVVLPNIQSEPAGLDESSVDGQRLAFSAYRAFGNPSGAPYTSQYMAVRRTTGWEVQAISPPQGLSLVEIGRAGETEYRSFTADLCHATLLQFSDVLLAPDAVSGYPNLYGQEICGGSSYRALTTVTPPTSQPNRFLPDVQGESASGECVVFRTADKLTPQAHQEEGPTAFQVYESCDGTLRLISALPTGEAAFLATAGTGQLGSSERPIRTINNKGAMSADGSTVYWTASSVAGALYVRLNATQPPSTLAGETCLEPGKACTVRVAPKKAFFWAASPNGAAALYTVEQGSTKAGTLFRYNSTTNTSAPIAGEVLGLMGASTDTARVYFVSREALGPEAEAGKPNLYLAGSSAGAVEYVGQLSAEDALTKPEGSSTNVHGLISPISGEPFRHVSQVTPGGADVVFMSNAQLTSYDNTDGINGEPVEEVYRFDATTKELSCISCNPSGARPIGRQLEAQGEKRSLWLAAQITHPNSTLYAPRVISEDGNRVFFESFEPLVQADVNGKADVYEWEAPGSGTCTISSPAYRATNDGCVSLLSSGQSARDSEFVDASATGADVFFSTIGSLVPQDEGLVDIYDARVEGGLASPQAQASECSGDACQPAGAAPSAQSPATVVPSGEGNKHEKRIHKKHHKHHKKHHKKKARSKGTKKQEKKPHSRNQQQGRGH